ncbi:MAG: RNA polymerase sigma factor [Bacteroidales bacterium]
MIEVNTDKKLWDDFRNGESYALSHIYHQYVQHLFRYGKKFSNDDELIKDSIQDLFFDLIRNREKLGSTDNIRFYLIASLRRRLAKSTKEDKLFISSEDTKITEAEITYSTEQELIVKEELSEQERQLQEGLKKLSPKQREILYYKYTCDFSYEQICELMSLKYASARKLMTRAISALRDVL